MVILIGNLPRLAAEKDLCDMLGVPTDARMRIVKKKSRSGLMQRYALVPVKRERDAQKLIKRVEGREWQGLKLLAHEYQHRTGANERRRLDWRSQPWAAVERRIDERRSRIVGADSLVA